MTWVREDLNTGLPLEVITSPKRIWIGEVGHPVALFTLWTDEERRIRCGVYPATIDSSGDGPLKRRTGAPADWSKARVGNSYVLTPNYENFSRSEVRTLIREEAKLRIIDELTEKAGANWETFRAAVRTRSAELLSAFDAGTSIGIRAGTINGSGGWPT
jgi:hypothetical protein